MTSRKMHSLCSKCAGIEFTPLVDSAEKLETQEQFDDFLLKSQGTSRQQLGSQILYDNLHDVENSSKRGCHLCTLIFSSLTLRWAGDGVWMARPSGVLRVKLDALERGSFLSVICDGFGSSELRLSLPPLSTQSSHGIAFAQVDSSPTSPQLISQLAKWLSVCENDHQHSGQHSESPLPSRLIDVGPSDGSRNPRLVFTKGQFGKYATITYRWGTSTSITTNSATLSSHISGIDLEALPKTLRDAILVTRKLGLKYIWIDALVIIQDSPEDWREQAAHMPAIYQNAWVNISADSAIDGSSGFLGDRDLLAIRSCYHKPSGYVISPNVPHVLDLIDRGMLSRRGWVLQERIFSSRIIHYGHLEVGWECQQTLASERLLEGRPHSNSSWRGASLRNLLNSANNASHEPHLTNTQVKLGSNWQKTRKNEVYAAWYSLVNDYTDRVLTYPGKDKLVAMSGIANAFYARHRSILGPSEWDMSDVYMSGLWIGDLARGLAYTARIRRDNFDSNGGTPIEWDPEDYSSWKSRSPSFSWTSLDDPVDCYESKDEEDELYEYDVEVLEAKAATSTANPWDSGESCWVVLRGIVVSQDHMSQISRQTSIDPTVRHDADLLPNTSFLRLRVSLDRYGTHQVQWLIIHPVGTEGDAYRRIGIVGTWGDFSIDLKLTTDIKLV